MSDWASVSRRSVVAGMEGSPRAAELDGSGRDVKHGARHPQYLRPQCRKPPVGEHVPDIREAVRIRKRRTLMQSLAITLCDDDREGYKLVRFRCRVRNNLAALQEDALQPLPSLKHAAAEGYLGCYQCLRG